MALFFNLELLEEEAVGDDDKFFYLLYYHYTGRLPPSARFKYKPTKRLNGQSFILNPSPLLDPSISIDRTYIVQYIKLAGRRDYLMYKIHGVKYLDKAYYPDLIEANLKTNPLLILTPKQIKFKYEEMYGSKIR
jgi:hypothetical protein